MVTPVWCAFNADIEAVMLPTPRVDFLRYRPIKGTMFAERPGSQIKHEMRVLSAFSSQLPCTLGELLREDYVGVPWLCEPQLMASSMTIQHAYHLVKYAMETHCGLTDASMILEWGGGYGGFARIVRRLRPSITYVLVDTDVALAMQWLYLSSILGPEVVHLIRHEDDARAAGAVNLLPFRRLDLVDGKADLFVSTFALSESPSSVQTDVANRSWFGAKHLLLAYQTSNPVFPKWEGTERLAVQSGAAVLPMEQRPTDRYAFK
jgi:hypothetical protein